jgi:hypothetical protein
MTSNNENRQLVCNQIVRANLGTCFTHAGLAKSAFEAGQQGLAERSLVMARSSHESTLRFLGHVEDEGQRDEVQTMLSQLGEKLDVLQRQMHPEAPAAWQAVCGG